MRVHGHICVCMSVRSNLSIHFRGFQQKPCRREQVPQGHTESYLVAELVPCAEELKEMLHLQSENADSFAKFRLI